MPKQNFHKQTTQPKFTDDEDDDTFMPESIGPYQIERRLGKGGMSLIFLGTDPKTRQAVVIKRLPRKFQQHSYALYRFKEETAILKKLRHSNIVKYVGSGDSDGVPYIALEYISGSSLRQHLQRMPPSLNKACEWAADVGRALSELHKKGAIHRDVKPENLLITADGEIKLIDFGIALRDKSRKKDASSLEKQVVGTPIYMSPEQKTSPSDVTEASDIYSLGLVTYELVTGKLSQGKVEIERAPKGLHKLLTKALQPKPEARFTSAADFIDAIEAYAKSPAAAKECKGPDASRQVAQGLVDGLRISLPQKAPHDWIRLSVGIARHSGWPIGHVVDDLIRLPEGQFGVLLAQPLPGSDHDPILAAQLLGAARGLAPLTADPVRLMEMLNEVICKFPQKQLFTMAYLVLNPSANSMKFTTSGGGKILQVPAGSSTFRTIECQNELLGSSKAATFISVKQRWGQGDLIVMDSLTALGTPKPPKAEEEKKFQSILMAHVHDEQQPLADRLLRERRHIGTQKKDLRGVTLLTLLRTD